MKVYFKLKIYRLVVTFHKTFAKKGNNFLRK